MPSSMKTGGPDQPARLFLLPEAKSQIMLADLAQAGELIAETSRSLYPIHKEKALEIDKLRRKLNCTIRWLHEHSPRDRHAGQPAP